MVPGEAYSQSFRPQDVKSPWLQAIHDRTQLMFVYTPGLFFLAHPKPQLTAPAKTNVLSFSRQASGPPLSPWQLSIRPCSYPAQSMRGVMRLPLYILTHLLRSIIGTRATRSLSDTGPDSCICPHPVTKHCVPDE